MVPCNAVRIYPIKPTCADLPAGRARPAPAPRRVHPPPQPGHNHPCTETAILHGNWGPTRPADHVAGKSKPLFRRGSWVFSVQQGSQQRTDYEFLVRELGNHALPEPPPDVTGHVAAPRCEPPLGRPASRFGGGRQLLGEGLTVFAARRAWARGWKRRGG